MHIDDLLVVLCVNIDCYIIEYTTIEGMGIAGRI